MNGHLGDNVAAFVDGELDYATRERALRHLDRCAGCLTAVEQERRVKQRIRSVPGAEPSAALLMALTDVNAAPGRHWPVPGDPTRHWPLPQGRSGRGGLLLAGAGSISAGVLGLAYVVGGAGAVASNPVSPPVGQFSAEFAGSEAPVPFSDPATDVFPAISEGLQVGGR